jgi:hypothetical protein
VFAEEGSSYTDMEYGCDIEVNLIGRTVVVATEIVSGNSRLYQKDDFTKERFEKIQ